VIEVKQLLEAFNAYQRAERKLKVRVRRSGVAGPADQREATQRAFEWFDIYHAAGRQVGVAPYRGKS
jgi:hypothetical protein